MEATGWTEHYVINTAGQSEQRGVDLLTQLPFTLIFNSQSVDVKRMKKKTAREGIKTNNITLPHRKKKKMPDVQSEEKPGADWRRLSGLQGQRFVSEEVKVRAKLAYLCKLKLSSRTTDGWFQLKCEHVTEGPLDSPNAHSFYGCNSLRTGKDKGTKWEKMKKMAGGSHIAQVISNNKIVTNCCLQRQKKKGKRGNMMKQPFCFVVFCFHKIFNPKKK